MKTSNRFSMMAALVTLFVSASGMGGCASEDPAPADTASPVADGHEGHMAHDTSGATGTGAGTVRSTSADGRSIVVSHGPIEGIGMGAMTMSFLVADDVALDGLGPDDQIAFAVESTDNDFRITALCRPAVDGSDCADGF